MALANFFECNEFSPPLEELASAAAAAAAIDPDVATKKEEKKSSEEDIAQSSAAVEAAPTKESSRGSARPKDAKSRSAETKPRSNVSFGTIDQLHSRDSSSDEEGQAFYAGGSKHSGQQVLGPSKRKDIINDMFKSCQGQAIAVADERPTGQHRNRPNTFGGTGYKLGQTSSDTEGSYQGRDEIPNSHDLEKKTNFCSRQRRILVDADSGLGIGNGRIRPEKQRSWGNNVEIMARRIHHKRP